MNAAHIAARVSAMVPGLTDVRVEPTKDRTGLHLICTKDRKMRVVYADVITTTAMLWGLSATVERTDEQIACELAQGLRQ